MAGIKLTSRLKASSILEVVVSMVVILVVFGIAMMIYNNVLRYSSSQKELLAKAILRETLLKDERNSEYSKQSIDIDDFRIEQDIKPYLESEQLIYIHLTAYDQNQVKVAEVEKIVGKHD